jgi:hypothetical protein
MNDPAVTLLEFGYLRRSPDLTATRLNLVSHRVDGRGKVDNASLKEMKSGQPTADI